MQNTYLALGDSYTIGEALPIHESFPYQTLQLLRASLGNDSFNAPEIIAKTGWTTDELLDHLRQTRLRDSYDWVSLLIGVNNQYRGRSVEEFREQFRTLFDFACIRASGRMERLFVLSIPDWGVTPFAQERDTARIAREIDAFNEVCRETAEQAGCTYLDITDAQRRDGHQAEFLAADRLHPSGMEYAKWARLMAQNIRHRIQGSV